MALPGTVLAIIPVDAIRLDARAGLDARAVLALPVDAIRLEARGVVALPGAVLARPVAARAGLAARRAAARCCLFRASNAASLRSKTGSGVPPNRGCT